MSISIPLTVLKELCNLNQYLYEDRKGFRSQVVIFAENKQEVIKILIEKQIIKNAEEFNDRDCMLYQKSESIKLSEITLDAIKRSINKVEKRQEEILANRTVKW